MISSRKQLCNADIIVIKAGTTVVSTPDGYPCISRMAALVESAVKLSRDNKKVIIISSGSVGVGKSILRRQEYKMGLKGAALSTWHNSACAASGQLGLMSLYDTMFSQYEVPTSQLLVTCFDFDNDERRNNIKCVLQDLLSHGIVPVINENDAVSANQGFKIFGDDTFSDNDSLAAIVSGLVEAKLMILLTDVAGVFNKPPSEPDAELIDIFEETTSFKEGQKSSVGRGGMGAKVGAVLRALDNGVEAALIAPGGEHDVVDKIMSGSNCGTLFLRAIRDGNFVPAEDEVPIPLRKNPSFKEEMRVEDMARGAKAGSRKLLSLDSEGRTRILLAIAAALEARQDDIIAVNQEDIAGAKAIGMSGPALHRLNMDEEKIKSLVDGIRSIAAQREPIGEVTSRTLISQDLNLEKTTVPIGVLLVIFESRPDCLPQIVALAIRSGNGVLLKGGKEAEKTNSFLHDIIVREIEKASDGVVDRSVIGLITSQSDIASLLKLDAYIDLVIPRGSETLVKYIKETTKIPVLGHSDGVCHLYVDKDADPEKALQLAIDGKTDYPSACNAIETILLHQHTVDSGLAKDLIAGLRAAGVKVRGGDRAIASRVLGSDFLRVQSFRTEYGDMTVSLDIVDDLQAAVDHINHFGSSHTDVIVTEEKETAEQFLRAVDSACVFHNASPRLADGYRFGLGAEVGISTSRIHARGPVGVEGLLTSKWHLRSTAPDGHTATMFSDKTPEAARKRYLHVKMAV
eukprot:CAMPEP_0182418620 /NCGR_PEP_ID=MMETSP1167-20130531/2997_1 /TAXON_ID=2988 /ORGANISM="Mallomonas Sp, Strain CCMP3275" /LENGTH=742 /DNA_ID=CAMNT_0024592905 /DNA_START=74 /DNA_END=2302 /DNA_ORIENTATION=+